MSGMFSSPKKPKLPPTPAPVEEVAVIEEDADVAGRKEKKRLMQGGRQSTIISGIQSALKSRLGA